LFVTQDNLIVTSNSQMYVNWFWLTEPYFVVQWCRMGHALDPDAELTFQVQLWQRSGQVRFVYDNLANGTGNYADGHEAVIGVRYHQNDLYPWPGTVGILSALEVIESNAPLVTIIDPDVDQDFLSNEKEAQIGTDPRNWDSDHDRMSDAWENYYRPTLNPLSNDANEDADGDGYLNIIECYLGSKPTDPASPTFSEPDTDQDGMPDSWETTLIDVF
jgi:hypothetical protein